VVGGGAVMVVVEMRAWREKRQKNQKMGGGREKSKTVTFVEHGLFLQTNQSMCTL